MITGVPVPDRPNLEATEGISFAHRNLPTACITSTSRVETESGAMAETYPGYEPATLDINVRKAITHALDRHLLADVQGAASARLGACLLVLSRRLRRSNTLMRT